MLALEIYTFFWISLLLIWFLFYRFLNIFLFPFLIVINFFKKEYYKYFSLNSIKKDLLNKPKELGNVVNNAVSEVAPELEDKVKHKVSKLFLEAKIVREQWKLDDYEKKLIELLSFDENNVDALEMLSNLYINLWKDKKAFSLLKKLIQIDMQNDNAIWNLSKIYMELWEIDTSYILIQKALEINPKNHRYYVTYADILYNKWELEESIIAIEKVLEIKPKNVLYIDALASLHEEIGNFSKAKSYWLEILDLEPTYERAKEKIKNF